MARLLLFLWFSTLCYGEEVTAQQALSRSRENVARQLSAVANYTCVLTVHRTLYFEPKRLSSGCAPADRSTEKPLMQDRLRLDVAVSDGNEIFSWHGGSKFSSAGVIGIVKSGPISSGSFVGYLRNILFTQGVAISLNKAESNDRIDTFQYYVPLKRSAYYIRGRKAGLPVAFHGSFAVSTDSLELQSLSVNAAEIPRAAEVCSANTDISYQKVEIAGKSLLIPKSFQLHVLDSKGVDTHSQSDYTQCREFRGESTLRFDLNDTPHAQSGTTVRDKWLPAGTELYVRLISTLDDKTSFTGDRVEGTLLNSLEVKQLNLTVPKGATLSGVVSRLELWSHPPTRHYLVAIHWDRMTWGQNSLLLSADPRRLYPQGRRFGSGYSGRSSEQVSDEAGEEGTFVWPTSHFRMDQTFTAYFETSERPKETSEETSGTAQPQARSR